MDDERTCFWCFHAIKNDLGYWCLRYSVYVFPDKGQGRNCSEYITKEQAALKRKEACKKMEV